MNPKQFSLAQTSSVLAIAIVGGVISLLQPILLGSLLADGRINAEQLGQAATLEGLGMAVAATLAGMLFSSEQLRLKIGAAMVVALAANLLTLVMSAQGILLVRLVHGASCGVLLWLVVGMFSRLEAPARLFAIYTTLQSCVAFLLASSFSAYLVPNFGATGGYSLIAIIDLVMLGSVAFIPRAYAALEQQTKILKPTPGGLWGLLGASTFIAGIMAFWVYLIPVGQEFGHSSGALSTIISFAIALQVLGGLCATILAPRLNARIVNVAAGLVCALMVWFVTQPIPLYALYAVIGMFSFFWMFTPAFHLPMVITLDSSRRSAMFISTAQLGGLSLGPLLSAHWVGGGSFAVVINVSISLFVVSSIVAALSLFKKTSPTVVVATPKAEFQ